MLGKNNFSKVDRLTSLNRFLLFLYLPVLNRKYAKRNKEPTARVAVGIGWLIKSPIEYLSVYLVCQFIATPSSGDIIEAPGEINVLLVALIVIGFWELIANKVIKLDERLYMLLEARDIRQYAEKYIRTNPSESQVLLIISVLAMIIYVTLFAIGGAYYVTKW